MRIGIISDLHAGLHEMQIAIAHLSKQDVDIIVCAGDLVDFGNHGDEVVKHIMETQIPCVKGNHDRQASQKQALRQRKQTTDTTIKLLSHETLSILEQLPNQLRFEWEGKSVLLTHATPWGDDMYIYPDSNPPLLRRVVREAQADITILGHTHRPMWIEVDGRYIINSGSTSQNYFMPVGTYAILTLPHCEFELHSVETGAVIDLEKRILK